MSIRDEVIRQFRQVAQEQQKQLAELDDDLPLRESGLDSLCFAVIAVRLEDALGIDPVCVATPEHAPFPVTLGEFINYYQNVAR
jgi:hypothetical protein